MPSGERNSRKTKCPQGHPYNKANTYTAKTGNRHCRLCHKATQNAAYQAKPVVLQKRVYGRKAEFRRKVNLLKKSCVLCGESAVECLDFHHKDPNEKIASVSWMISNGRPWALIEAEIVKCYVLCANCHRKLEASRRRKEHEFYDTREQN